MIDALAITIIVSALLFSGWALVNALRDRPPTRLLFVGAALLELVLVVQEAIAAQHLVDGDRPPEMATFIGYLITSLVILPIGGWLASLEQTRWGSAILAFAGVVIPVLVLRLQQLWEVPVG